MGFFSSAKTNLPKSTDKVWKTRSACLKGIVTESLLAIQNNELPIIITFFEDSHKELIEFLDLHKASYHSVESLSADLAREKNLISVVGTYSSTPLRIYLQKETSARVLFLGRYPFVAHENKILEDLSAHLPKASFSFCLSLDDPFFELFGANSIRPMMEQLGMKDDECIEHSMVSKAIKNALEKVNKNVTIEMKAKSEKDWFSRNVRK